ncbi:MAG TPA: hypothetical protein VGL66_07550 [Caulobacteraceae bacterium]|jgi:hypothetical protein
MESVESKRLAAAISEDRVVSHVVLSVLIAREIERGGPEAEKTLSEEIHEGIDRYVNSGVKAPDLVEMDRQRGRDVVDALFGLARVVRLLRGSTP